MAKTIIKDENEEQCLNCGASVSGHFCSNCGQKLQPTKLPLRLYIDELLESLFNIDNRLFKTIKDLFAKPGRVTIDYLEGKRASYLPPLKIYLSISVVYFLLARTIDSTKVFFVNFGEDSLSSIGLGHVIQYALFFLVPVMALFIQLFHRKRNGYYVEYLVFSLHLHSVWFVFLSFQLLAIYLLEFIDTSFSSIPYLLLVGIDSFSQILPLIYLTLQLKKVFNQGYLMSILKSFGVMFLYLFTLGGIVLLFLIL